MSEATSAVWIAVDLLTKQSHRTIHHDDGSRTDAVVPSLWDQATGALQIGLESTGGSRGPLCERSPVDVDLMEVRSIIAGTTVHELATRRLKPRPTVPRQLRQLATHVIGHEPAELWWWEYRFSSWAHMLSTYLHTYDRQPQPVRLRNSPCPHCDVRQVRIETEDGPRVVPALVIDFRDGYVRAAECSACGFLWWRGQDLERLAELLAG